MKKNVRVGVPQYTYHKVNKEEKVIYRRLAIIGGATLVILLIIWFWGLTFVRVIGWLGTKSSGSESTPSPEYQIPLQKPAFSDLPEFTNQDKLTVSGTTSNEANVVLTVNGSEVGKNVADASGSFSFVNVTLKAGTNLLKVAASDKSGETLTESAIITLDKEPPNLQVSEPANNQRLPKDTQRVTIKGSAEVDSTVFINSIQTMLDQNNSFSYSLSASVGENKIEVKATDKAGNEKIVNLTVFVEQ